MNLRRRQQEEAWALLGAVGWPEDVGDPVGEPIVGGQTYADYIASLAPLFWLRLRETSGTTPENSGSVSGLTIVWTPGVGSVGVTGKLGANEAYEWDGANSKITITNDAAFASIKALTTQRRAVLINMDGLGESAASPIWCHDSNFSDHLLRTASTNRLLALMNTTGTDPTVTTNNNEISDFIGAWRWLFMDYDDADAMGLGRRIRLFKSVPGSGVITPLTMATDTAGTGTIAQPNAELNIGNFSDQTRTQDGKIDEVIISSGLWTPAASPTDYTIMETISRLTPA